MNTQLLLIGTPELLVIALIVLLLFGGKKIPELMRSLGLGVKNFKEGMKDETKTNTYSHVKDSESRESHYKENDINQLDSDSNNKDKE